jgi:hypothetical protein
MNITLREGLPFVTALLRYGGCSVALENVLLDMGSAGSIFAADALSDIGVRYEPDDPVFRIRGVGGSEFVFVKQVESLAVGPLHATACTIEVGAMDYGLPLDGILGTDFLISVGAMIDMAHMELRPAT